MYSQSCKITFESACNINTPIAMLYLLEILQIMHSGFK